MEYDRQLHHLIIDFKATYYSIISIKVYTAIRKFGISVKLVRLVRLILTNVGGQIKATRLYPR